MNNPSKIYKDGGVNNSVSQFHSLSKISRQYPETSKDTKKLYQKAINIYRKICSKTFSAANNTFIMNLKCEHMNLYIDNFGLKEIQAISRVVSLFFYFKGITVGISDPNSK